MQSLEAEGRQPGPCQGAGRAWDWQGGEADKERHVGASEDGVQTLPSEP